MVFVKFIYNPYRGEDALFQVASYIANWEKTNGYFGGVNTSNDVHRCVQEMMAVKQFFLKTDGKQLHHFVVSCQEFDWMQAGYLFRLGFEIGKYFAGEYQVFFGVHLGDHPHIHFMVNSVSYRNGKKLSVSEADGYRIQRLAKELMERI